jgi:hypothetical protein
VPAEHVIVSDFFAASRLRDLTALSRFATTVFEPLEQGIVSDFEIRAIAAAPPDGEFLVKEVAVAATVRTPDGSTVGKTLVVVLRRQPMATGNPVLYDGWRVVAVRERAPS